MSVFSHIEALQAKHGVLEQQIQQEMLRPAPDFFELANLKKQKLLLKEEIEFLISTGAQPRKSAS